MSKDNEVLPCRLLKQSNKYTGELNGADVKLQGLSKLLRCKHLLRSDLHSAISVNHISHTHAKYAVLRSLVNLFERIDQSFCR